MEEALEFKCPACGASLAFSPEHGKLRCASCDNLYEIDDMRAYAESEQGTVEFDWGAYNKGTDTQLLNAAVYVCHSCGAEIVAEPTTVATKCPFCDNNVVLSDRVEGILKPNGVIPFKVSKKDLLRKVKEFQRNKPLLPFNFLSPEKLENVQSIYVPFWLFDCDIAGGMQFDATKVRVYVQGDYNVTETRHFLISRSGEMSFEDVPADASVKIDNDLMDSVEPYDFSAVVPFDEEYLPGFMADRFDDNPDSCLPRASTRIMNSAVTFMRNTISGYQTVSLKSSTMQVVEANASYVLLPVYLLNLTYHEKTYRYAINGQTGKVVGELPISFAKALLWFIVIFLIAGLIAFGIAACVATA